MTTEHEHVDWNVPLDADEEDQLGLRSNVGGVVVLGSAGETEPLLLLLAVLLDVLLSTLEDLRALLLVGLECLLACVVRK